jgi:hypothetical protein
MTSGSKTDGAKAFAAWHNQGLTKKPAKGDHRRLTKAVVAIATGKPPVGYPTPEEPGRKGGRTPASRRRSIG